MLVGIITSSRHDYCQEALLYLVRRLSYPNYDYVIVDLDEDVDNYLNLKGKGYKVIKMEYTEPSVRRLAEGREAIRQIALKENFAYILYLDADLIIPKNIIERLMAHGKDCTGFLYNYGTGPTYPSIAKSGVMKMDRPARCNMDMMDLYTWEEVYEQLYPRLIKCYGCGIGLISRKVFEIVPWRYCPYTNIGEDVQYWHECNDKGFEWWCDTSMRLLHLNIDWNDILHSDVKCTQNKSNTTGPCGA